MDENNLLEVLQEIFRDALADEEIVLNEETSANDIEGWDSLTHITILESIQGQFNISFTIDEIIEMKNVRDILNAIKKKVGEEE